MKHKLLALLLAFAIAGCETSKSSDPFVVSPSPTDWDSAFARLQPREQIFIKEAGVSIGTAAAALDGSLYHYGYGPPNGKPTNYDVLDIQAICEGYNRRFAPKPARSFRLARIVSYVGWGDTEGGTQFHSFRLDCSFEDSAGVTRHISAEGDGPGVRVIWGAPRTAVEAEINQALAITFLRAVLHLCEPTP